MVVSVIAGVVFVQRVFQQHMHILHKQGMARTYIVTDLAANDGGLAALDRQLGAKVRELGVGAALAAQDSPSPGAAAGEDGDSSAPKHKFLMSGHSGLDSRMSPSPSAPPAYSPLDRSLDDQDIELGGLSATEGTALVPPSSRAGEGSDNSRVHSHSRHFPAPSAPLLSLAQRKELADLGLL